MTGGMKGKPTVGLVHAMGAVSGASNIPGEVLQGRSHMALKVVLKSLDFILKPMPSSCRNLSRGMTRSRQFFKDSPDRQYR